MLVPFTAKDFNTLTHTVIFQASNSTSDVNIPISIPINDDDIDEGGEEFVVFVIFQASNSTSDVNIPISIPINDDDVDEGGEEFVVFVELVDAVEWISVSGVPPCATLETMIVSLC